MQFQLIWYISKIKARKCSLKFNRLEILVADNFKVYWLQWKLSIAGILNSRHLYIANTFRGTD